MAARSETTVLCTLCRDVENFQILHNAEFLGSAGILIEVCLVGLLKYSLGDALGHMKSLHILFGSSGLVHKN